MHTSLNEANYKLCPRWKFYRSCSFMSGTTWQCKDNSTFKASACFDSIFFFWWGGGQGQVRAWRSICSPKKKKTPKKKKREEKKNKRERETNKKHSSTWHVMSCVSCSCECIECLRKPSFICVNLKFKYITINYGIYIQRGSVTMNNRKLKTQRFIL